MRRTDLDLLMCIVCNSEALSLFTENDTESIEDAVIKCDHCFTIYPVIDGIPCFLPEALRDEEIRAKSKMLVSKLTKEAL